MKLTVVNQASFSHDRNIENKDLRRQVKDKFSVSVRRMDNFTLSGLAAVAKLNITEHDPETLSLISCAQYFSVELLQDLLIDVQAGKSIKPLDFVSTVGNAANFYIAKEFAIHGSNLFLGANQLALEKTLLISALELADNDQQHVIALVWNETDEQRVCHALLLESPPKNSPITTLTAEEIISAKTKKPFNIEIEDFSPSS